MKRFAPSGASRYPPRMLHVANGDDSLSILRGAGLPGQLIAWSDVLDLGPLRGEPATTAFRLARARWLEENGAGTLSEVNAQLEAWDAALQAPAEERVLWFEADLTCQLALLHHLVLVDASAVVTQEPVPEQRDFAALPDRGAPGTRQRSVPDRARGAGGGRFVPAGPDARIRALDHRSVLCARGHGAVRSGVVRRAGEDGVSRRPPRLSRSRQGPLGGRGAK